MKSILVIIFIFSIFFPYKIFSNNSNLINDLSNDLMIQKQEITKTNQELNNLKQKINTLENKSNSKNIFDWLNLVPIILASLALILSFKAFITSLNDNVINRFYNLIAEYQSDEFGKAITELWDFYNEIEKLVKNDEIKDEKEIIEQTKIRVQKEYKKNYEIKYKNKLDLSRRKVSNFYVRVYILLKYKKLKDSFLSIYWDKNNLEIIDKIIIPIENVLAEILLKNNNPIPNKKIAPLENLYKIISKSKKIK